MGAWGTDILEDDTSADVYADYMDRFEAGMKPAAIRAELETEYADSLDDYDDMTSFWLALAKAQWECGQLQPDVLARVTAPIFVEQDLRLWEDSEETDLEQRKQVLSQFLAVLGQQNLHPHKRGDETTDD